MNAKKQRDKNRRRANKLAREAWEAAEDHHLPLAVRIIRRATGLNPANPVLWHDQGALLALSNEDDQAADAFQAAIQLAPDFAQAYADLAAIRARQGKLEQAVTLAREAVRHAPQLEQNQQALAAYEALLAAGCGDNAQASVAMPAPPVDSRADVLASAGGSEQVRIAHRPIADFVRSRSVTADDGRNPHEVRYTPCRASQGDGAPSGLAAAVGHHDWSDIDSRLTEHGFAHLSQLLNADQCQTLRLMFDDDRLFAKTVTMKKEHFGRGVYRYFAAPLPPLVDTIRQSVYPPLAEIANRWQRLLACDEQFPATWPTFRERCAEAGQTTPSPLMLRYETGGFNALHQDLRGDVFFPVQLVVVLSPRADAVPQDDKAFTGGEFLFCDQPERKPADRRLVPAGLGDAVLFCTRSRLMRVGGVYGLMPVKHGLNRIASGIRYAIGIPFHDFR